MSDQPVELYPGGSIARLVYIERKCCDCNDKPVNWSGDNLRCQACCIAHMDREQGKHWANHVLRRCEEDSEFREQLRAVLGVPSQQRRHPEFIEIGAHREVVALTARLAVLEAEVARLAEKLTPKGTVSISSVWPVSPPVSCPECESTDVQRLPWILTSEPPQQPWACRICNHRWNTRC